MKSKIEKAYAKINLTLDVLDKHHSGYHNIESVMQQLYLHDSIELKIIDKEIKINCNPKVCPNNGNLAYKAANILIKDYGIKEGVEITIEKHIPIAAGLGGGSADAAATLRVMNNAFNLDLSKDELIKISKGIGMDVAFCLFGGTAYATGNGNELQKIEKIPKFYVVLAKPKFDISTKYAYKNLDYEKTGKQLKTVKMLNAIKEKDINKIADNLHNDFEYSVCREYPIINEIKQKMIQNGVLNAVMSGSGPTVFGITEKKAVAENIRDSFKKDPYFKKNLDFVYVTQTR